MTTNVPRLGLAITEFASLSSSVRQIFLRNRVNHRLRNSQFYGQKGYGGTVSDENTIVAVTTNAVATRRTVNSFVGGGRWH